MGRRRLTPAASDRLIEGLKADTLARRLSIGLPAPSPAAVQKFIADHPNAFENRKFLVVDQLELSVPGKSLAEIVGHKVTNLDEVQTALDQAKIGYRRGLVVVDTGGAAPQTVARMLATPANEVFEISDGTNTLAGQVPYMRAAPLRGTEAVQVATTYLRNEAGKAAIKTRLEALRKASADKMEYSPGYTPN